MFIFQYLFKSQGQRETKGLPRAGVVAALSSCSQMCARVCYLCTVIVYTHTQHHLRCTEGGWKVCHPDSHGTDALGKAP